MTFTKYSIMFTLLAMYHCESECESMCSSLDTCSSDKHSSYCKSWQSPSVCFGLYWRDDSKSSLCFQPNDSSCPETLPVECPAVQDSTIDSTTVEPTTASSTETSDATTTTETPATTTVLISTNSTSSLSSGPSGEYCGTYNFENINVDAHLRFNETVGIHLSGLLNGTLEGVPFVYTPDSIVLNSTYEPYVTFLNELPYKLVPEDIVLGYEEDTVLASILGMQFNMTHSQC